MRDKLYLIKVNLETFIGPLSYKEIRDEYKRMSFGLQDEVAASNNKWVVFDDLVKIKQVYPELLELIKKEMLSGWAITDPQLMNITKKTITSQKKKSGFIPKLLVLAILTVSVAIIANHLSKNGISNDVIISTIYKDPHPSKANLLYNSNKIVQFEAYMDRHRKKIIHSKNIKDWLPYLRFIAYNRDGQILGLRPQMLRDERQKSVPKDCSMNAWKSRWDKSKNEWNDFLKGTSLPKKDWARLLLWDPYWIGRRLPVEGWLLPGIEDKNRNQPGNYHEACLYMALKGLASLDNVALELKPLQETLLARLTFQLNIIHQEAVKGELDGSLWVLSCYESSERVASLDECKDSDEYVADWERFLKEVRVQNEIRIILEDKNQVSAENLETLRKLLESAKSRNPFTGLDYSSENRFFQQVNMEQGKILKAIESIKSRLPELDFNRHFGTLLKSK